MFGPMARPAQPRHILRFRVVVVMPLCGFSSASHARKPNEFPASHRRGDGELRQIVQPGLWRLGYAALPSDVFSPSLFWQSALLGLVRAAFLGVLFGPSLELG